MHNNKKTVSTLLPLALAGAVAMSASQSALAEIVLYDQDDTRFSTDGYFNTFYVHSDVDRAGEQFDRKQSRVKMGFLPNYIGFNFSKQANDLKLGGRSSFWVTINDIGSGYPYPFPTSQVTYRSPVMSGLRVAVGIMDPVDTTEDTSSTLDKAYQEEPRIEAEVTYQFELGGTQFYTWINAVQQNSDNTDNSIEDMTSKGLGYRPRPKSR